ncbi:MAG: FKBP-type peptidyl-prolyl cis-trans isomerase [Acidimicrobiales bacterium]
MAGSKRDRQRQGRQAKQAALAAARRRAAMRRRAVFLGIGAVAVVLLALLLTRGGSSKKKVTTSASTTSTAPGASTTALASAAGKPCVAVSDPLPAGAPQVPVKVGPPPTSLVSEDWKVGTGATVTPGATVTVNYIGVSCSTGKIFDSSYSRNQAASFSLASVIKGWQDAIPGMKVGGQRLLGIPPAAGYGTTGQPPTIAPDETLWFVVEVTDTKPA